MPRSVRYVPDHKSMKLFLVSEEVREPLALLAASVIPAAVALTPRSKGPGPHMADLYRLEIDAGTIKTSRNRRVLVRVWNDSPHAAAVEFGGPRNKRVRPLGRAASTIGDWRGDE